MDKERCQSCGMPLSPGFYGTEKEEGFSHEYCRFCFHSGEFTKPDMTLKQMIGVSTYHMVNNLKFTEKKAKEMAKKVIPKLKRWKK